jgi:hypothetical protein
MRLCVCFDCVWPCVLCATQGCKGSLAFSVCVYFNGSLVCMSILCVSVCSWVLEFSLQDILRGETHLSGIALQPDMTAQPSLGYLCASSCLCVAMVMSLLHLCHVLGWQGCCAGERLCTC